MHKLGNFSYQTSSRNPYVVAIAFDTLTKTPQFALVQESANEIPVVYYNGLALTVRGILSDVSFNEDRPKDGGGVVRRTGRLNIQTEHEKGYPFYRDPITKKFYQGGQTSEDIYFAVFANDRSKMLEDIRKSWCIGLFKVDAGIEWDEENGSTSIPLIDLIFKDRTKIGATTEDIPELFFLFNPGFSGGIIPKVFGFVPRIRGLNAFPSISTKKIAGAIGGVVGADYTNVSTEIILERHADRSSVLRQLIAIGGSVRIRMKDNEVIKGTLSYDSGTGDVTLTVEDRDTYYAQGQAYTHAPGETPANWHVTKHMLPMLFSWGASKVVNGKNIIQDSNGYMEAELQFYDALVPSRKHTETVSWQMEGWFDEKESIVSHKVPESVTYGQAILSADFSPTVLDTDDYWLNNLWPPSQYIFFKETTIPVNFYFNDPSSSSAGSGVTGDSWTLVAIEPASTDYSTYIRNGFSRFDSDHVYAEGDGRLIKIPSEFIVSVTQSTTAYGLANMAKITLTAAPVDLDIGASNNNIYVDAMYREDTNENRTERILYEIMKESDTLYTYAGSTINGAGYPTENQLPYVGVLVRDDELLTDIIDRLCFQIGCSLMWEQDRIELVQTAYNHDAWTVVTDGGNDYYYPNLAYTDESEMIENTASLEVGELTSIVNSDGYEYIPLYLDLEYGGWEDPFFKIAKSSVNRAMRKTDFKFGYKFDMINDVNSFAYAVGLALSIGHASGLSMVERCIKTDMTIDGCRWGALDPIVFRDFPLLSTADETDAVINDDGQPMYLIPDDETHRIMGAVGVVDAVQYIFNIDSPVQVKLVAKMSQLFVNARGIDIYQAPYPPLPPPDPSPDPNIPPNTGGGSDDEFNGGTYSPMMPVYTLPDAVEINSLDPETATFTLTVNDDFIWNAGWSWDIAIIAQDGSSYPLDGVAISASPGAGSFPDKISDTSPVQPVYTITLSVDYRWFQPPVPYIQVERSAKIRITRHIFYNKVSSDYYDDHFDIPWTITLKDVPGPESE